MFNTGTITPAASGRTWSYTGDFSSNNTFAEDDSLFIFWKKIATQEVKMFIGI